MLNARIDHNNGSAITYEEFADANEMLDWVLARSYAFFVSLNVDDKDKPLFQIGLRSKIGVPNWNTADASSTQGIQGIMAAKEEQHVQNCWHHWRQEWTRT